MKKISLLVGAVSAALVFAAPRAFADPMADSGATSNFDWTGFYAGLNAGYGFSGNTQFVDTDSNSLYFAGLNPKGSAVGAQVGFNVQGLINPNFVAGLEADIQGSGIGESGFNSDYDYDSQLNSFGTLRGRIGYAAGPTLFYLTGGLAYGNIQKTTNTYGSYFADSTLNASALGYVLGGGVEYQVNQHWSLKAEYQYMNFGKNDVCDPPAYQCFGASNTIKDDDYHLLRLGVNFHF